MAIRWVDSAENEIPIQDGKKEEALQALKNALEGRSDSVVLSIKQDWALTMREPQGRSVMSLPSLDAPVQTVEGSEQEFFVDKVESSGSTGTASVAIEEEADETKSLIPQKDNPFFVGIRNTYWIFRFLWSVRRLSRLEKRFLASYDRVVGVSHTANQASAIWLRSRFEKALENQDQQMAAEYFQTLKRLEHKWWWYH